MFRRSSGVQLVVCIILFLRKDVIIVNHLVQFFETMKSEAEVSEPQKPEVAALHTTSRSGVEFGSWRLREKRRDGPWGGGVERGKRERVFDYHCVKTVKKI